MKVAFNINDQSTLVLPPQNFLNRYYSNGIETVQKSSLQIHFGLIIYYLFGVELKDEELEFIGKYGLIAALSTTTPESLHFLVGNNYLRRIWNDVIFFWKNLFQNDVRFTSTEKHKLLQHYIRENNINEDMAYIMLAQGLVFAGGRGAFKNIVQRF